MDALNRSKLFYPALLLFFTALSSTTCFAERGVGGGFHGNAGGFHNGGYHDDNYHAAGVYHHNNDYYVAPGVGNYYPGAGWGAPAVIVNPNNQCQSIQQCDSNGNCVQTQECN